MFPADMCRDPEPARDDFTREVRDKKFIPTYLRWANPLFNGKHAIARRQRAIAKKAKKRSK